MLRREGVSEEKATVSEISEAKAVLTIQALHFI